ncbi:hypothetical protein AB0M50_50120 [Nonomuraea fuscirosea]|uniref:hypothetical protein n=1 Tax=Nonomuraea fuscirosea TaxID=1291556 RepID=UPI00341A09D6
MQGEPYGLGFLQAGQVERGRLHPGHGSSVLLWDGRALVFWQEEELMESRAQLASIWAARSILGQGGQDRRQGIGHAVPALGRRMWPLHLYERLGELKRRRAAPPYLRPSARSAVPTERPDQGCRTAAQMQP